MYVNSLICSRTVFLFTYQFGSYLEVGCKHFLLFLKQNFKTLFAWCLCHVSCHFEVFVFVDFDLVQHKKILKVHLLSTTLLIWFLPSKVDQWNQIDLHAGEQIIAQMGISLYSMGVNIGYLEYSVFRKSYIFIFEDSKCLKS